MKTSLFNQVSQLQALKCSTALPEKRAVQGAPDPKARVPFSHYHLFRMKLEFRCNDHLKEINKATPGDSQQQEPKAVYNGK